MGLREDVIKLALDNEGELRKVLVPILRKTAAPSYRDYVDKKHKQGDKPLSEKEWKAQLGGGQKVDSNKLRKVLEKYDSLCLDDARDRANLSKALAKVVGGDPKTIARLLEKHESRCMDSKEDREAVFKALSKL